MDDSWSLYLEAQIYISPLMYVLHLETRQKNFIYAGTQFKKLEASVFGKHLAILSPNKYTYIAMTAKLKKREEACQVRRTMRN